MQEIPQSKPVQNQEPNQTTPYQLKKQGLQNNTQTLHKKYLSQTGLLPPPKLLGTQLNQTYQLYRPQSTVILNSLKPFERNLIPVTWQSCQCPALNKQQEAIRKRFEKNSFIPATKSTYYNNSYYNYLKKYSGDQHARLQEPKCMYSLSKARVKSQEQQKRASSQTQLQKNIPQKSQFMQQTNKIFGNSNFFYTGDHFQRADELKQTEYHPQNIHQLRSCLYYDERTKSIPKTTIKNNIMEGIIREGTDILQNSNLVDQLFKLKNQKLIKQYQENMFNGKDGKVRFVYNDYHSMGSKGGYSRGALGTFYTR